MLMCFASTAQTNEKKVNLQLIVGTNNATKNSHFGNHKWVMYDPHDGYSEKYYEVDHYSPVVSISAMYEITQHIQIGGDIELSTARTKATYEATGKTETHTTLLYGAMASVKFLYTNKPNYSLYSGGSVGYCRETKKSADNDEIKALGQLTAIGIRYGSKWYCTAELGAGIKGFVSGGVGYRF